MTSHSNCVKSAQIYSIQWKPWHGFNHMMNGKPFISVIICISIVSNQLDLCSAIQTSTQKELEPSYGKLMSNDCLYPCNCRTYSPNCRAGVDVVKDGCDCCFMCARQQGDLCDTKNICDEEKGLYCEYNLDGQKKGICRAKAAKPCIVSGTLYKDGEEFKPNCSQLCTCQNGQYSCSTLCPQEDRAPSFVHCKNPMLVKIETRCCKEWVCPNVHNLPDPNPHEYESPDPSPTNCKRETGEWSACSATCGMGWSLRTTNDNKNCQPIQERRLCYIRPCDQNDKHLKGKDCKSTWKESQPRRLINEDDKCESVQEFKLKYCSTCKKKKCCGPGVTKTKNVEFHCQDGKIYKEKFMWVKNCDCFKARRCPFT